MKVFLGADHNGFRMKAELADYLRGRGFDVYDDGDKKLNPADDFPVFAVRVVKDVLSEKAFGILLCGSGQGMCMTANRFRGIRACLGYDTVSARSSRNDDDSNILCIPANTLKIAQVKEIVDVWLDTLFANAPRFNRRIQEMDEV